MIESIGRLLSVTPTPFPYSRTVEQVRWDPLVVLHTSGSTGVPKPVFLKQGIVASARSFRKSMWRSPRREPTALRSEVPSPADAVAFLWHARWRGVMRGRSHCPLLQLDGNRSSAVILGRPARRPRPASGYVSGGANAIKPPLVGADVVWQRTGHWQCPACKRECCREGSCLAIWNLCSFGRSTAACSCNPTPDFVVRRQ